MLCTTVPAIVHLALQCSTEPAGQDPARSSARRMWLAWSWYVMICYDLYGKVLVLHGFTWFYHVLPCFTSAALLAFASEAVRRFMDSFLSRSLLHVRTLCISMHLAMQGLRGNLNEYWNNSWNTMRHIEKAFKRPAHMDSCVALLRADQLQHKPSRSSNMLLRRGSVIGTTWGYIIRNHCSHNGFRFKLVSVSIS